MFLCVGNLPPDGLDIFLGAAVEVPRPVPAHADQRQLAA